MLRIISVIYVYCLALRRGGCCDAAATLALVCPPWVRLGLQQQLASGQTRWMAAYSFRKYDMKDSENFIFLFF